MTVLLAHDIERLCKTSEPMIEPFCTSRLRAASYQLTLGPDIHIGGEEQRLEPGKPVVLHPHQVWRWSARWKRCGFLNMSSPDGVSA